MRQGGQSIPSSRGRKKEGGNRGDGNGDFRRLVGEGCADSTGVDTLEVCMYIHTYIRRSKRWELDREHAV